MNIGEFAAKAPYPSLAEVIPSGQDLMVIRSDYAGLVSEFSAIAQYVYHQLEAKGDGLSQVGRTLLSIAQVEMRHLNLFGEMILKLGGDPKFYYQENCHLVYWRGDQVMGGCDLREMVTEDIRLERETIACYNRQAEQVEQPAIGMMLRRIVLDEEIHVKILEEMLSTLL